ncbi:hypothetical protein L209DRAFT_184802 [Thermothelomyces heterothallicus CBS 203.75]
MAGNTPNPPPSFCGRSFGAIPPPPVRRPQGRLKLRPNFYNTELPSRAIRFRFRTRVIHATATPADGVHRHVLRLHVQPSLVQQIIQALVNVLLPRAAQVWFQSCFPEWALPGQLVLKKQKDGWDEEFETEKATYAKLAPLQDVVIPRCFGQLRYKGTRALLLSDIGGVCLATPEGGLLDLGDFRRMMRQALDAFLPFGILQDDSKLDNYHLVGDKIMVVDLERVSDGLTDKQFISSLVESEVKRLAQCYEEHQTCLWMDGFVTIDK